MSALTAVLLVGAGVLAGLASTIAGLASLVSYPALLAVGLPPLTANVTNTVALATTTVGAVAGSRSELRGQGRRLRLLGPLAAAGGAAGALLLLVLPAEAFEVVVPWLIGSASLVILVQPLVQPLVRSLGLRRGQPPAQSQGRGGSRPRGRARAGALLPAGVLTVAGYAGYFGAGAGVLALALLTAVSDEPLARVNALKNVLTGLANAVAALGFAVFGPVDWLAAGPLAAGFLVGGALGPAVVRRLPADLLRTLIALAGLALAVRLGLEARI